MTTVGRGMETEQVRARSTRQDPGMHAPGQRPREVVVQRKAIAPTMPPLPPMHPRAAPTNRTGLPDPLKSGIERLSGLAMDDVRVHFNSSAPAGLDAHAFTRGRDIHVAPGQAHHLAHEAWHVVQQKQGRVRADVQFAGAAVNADVGLEREADVMGARAASLGGREASAPMMTRSSPVTGGGPGVVQCKSSEVKKADKARRAAKLGYSVGFEKKLGIAAYKDPRALKAADKMIQALLNSMIPSFIKSKDEHQKAFSDLFGRDFDKGGQWSAGQVGKQFDTLFAALSKGNLRERMTAVMNASLGGFKAEVVRLMAAEDWLTLGTYRSLDVEKLQRRHRQMKLTPTANDLLRDPRNPIDRKHQTTWKWEFHDDPRVENPLDKQSTRTLRDLATAGIGLSDAERRYMFPDKKNKIVTDERVRWREGGSYWQVNPDSEWVKKCQKKYHMPVMAAPSGTTMRLFQTWEYLKKPVEKEELRLALLGWMLTSNDHSFHEIMMTAAEFGMPYEPGLQAYRDVAPFTPAELRAISQPEGFPDEQAYRADHMTAGSQNSIFATPEQINEFSNILATAPAGMWASGAAPTGGQLALAFAVLVYTDDANSGTNGHAVYKFMNKLLKDPDGRSAVAFYLHKDTPLYDDWKADKFTVKELVREAKLHSEYMKQGLDLLQPFAGPTYRGFRRMMKPKVGDTITDTKFFSSSKQQHVAEGFMNKDTGTYRILVRINNPNGRDIADLSMFGEKEVIFPPGTTFQVTATQPNYNGLGSEYILVDWQ